MGTIQRSNMKRTQPVGWQEFPNGEVELTFSNGNRFTMQPYEGVIKNSKVAGQIARDSGQVSAFRPAQYVKPQGLIKQVQRAWQRMTGYVNPINTTEQGAASAASPVTYYLTLWSQRFERRAMIEDCRSLFLSDPRIKRSVWIYCDEACRGGVKIDVQGESAVAERARKIAEKVEKLFTATLLRGWAAGLVLEGDLFIQHVLDETGKELLKCKRMPGIGMERLTDDADEFVNPNEAYAHVDSMTFEGVATFSESLMSHTRWNHIDGDRYGVSEIIEIRRLFRLLELMEQAQCIRRMVRAAQRRLHNIGSKDDPGQPADIANYKAINGFVEGDQEPFDPMATARDYFGNGLVEITTLDGDPNIEKIDDLKYMLNQVIAGLPTPPVFFGNDAESVNRDVIEDMRDIWYKSVSKLNEALEHPISHAFKLALTQMRIDPEMVDFTVNWNRSSLEAPKDIVDRTIALKNAKIISSRTAASNVQEYTKVKDIDKEIKEIDKETQEELKQAQNELSPVKLNTGGKTTNESQSGKQESRTNGKSRAGDSIAHS